MKRTGIILMAGALLLVGAQAATAADLTWGSGGGGGAGTWDTNNTVNWYDGSGDVVWTADSNAIFAGTAGTVSVDTSGVSANKLTFSTDAYTLQNNALNMSGAEINVGGGVTATINSSLTGSAGLSVTGTGTLVLNGSNTGLSGNVAVSNTATLGIGNNNALGSGWITGATGSKIMAVGGPRTIANRLDVVGVTIAGSNDITFTGQWGSNTGPAIVITNTGKTEFAGSWAPAEDAGAAMDIYGDGVHSANLVISGTNETPWARVSVGNQGPFTGSVTYSGTMLKHHQYLFGNNNNPSDAVFTVKIASDTAFVPTGTDHVQTSGELFAYRGVTFQAEGAARTVDQTLLARGVNFAGSNDLTFTHADPGYSGVSGVLRTAPPGDSTNWFSFNGGRVTFDKGVMTEGAQNFEVRGTTGTMVVNNTANFQAATTIAGATLLINGTMTAGNGSAVAVNGGALGGIGNLSRAVTVGSGGALAPGDPIVSGGVGTLTISNAGTTTILGNLAMDVTGAGSGSSDRLTMTAGTLDISSGTLTLNVLSALDDPAYVLADYTALVGTAFSSVVNLPTGYTVNYTYNGGTQIALIGSTPPEWNYILGDFDRDGTVGPEDFAALKDNFGSTGLSTANHASWTLGDCAGAVGGGADGIVGPEDFAALKDNFGATGGQVYTPLSSVPEPATLALLALAGLAIRRKQR